MGAHSGPLYGWECYHPITYGRRQWVLGRRRTRSGTRTSTAAARVRESMAICSPNQRSRSRMLHQAEAALAVHQPRVETGPAINNPQADRVLAAGQFHRCVFGAAVLYDVGRDS